MSAREARGEPWSRDLCAEYLAGRLDPCVAREGMLLRMLRVLSRRTKRNLVLVGKPGVGKTALAEGLASLLVNGRVPPSLSGRGMVSLDLGSMLSGTSFRGDFEGRVAGLVRKLRSSSRGPVLFVDEIHLILRAGRSEGGLDAGNLLKPVLARGDIVCLGASTAEEWSACAASDPALARRFSVLEVNEPDRAQSLRILEALRPGLESHHKLAISDEALRAALDMPPSSACPTGMPDRAIDRLDEACAFLMLDRGKAGPPADCAEVSCEGARRSCRPAFSLRERSMALRERSVAEGCSAEEGPAESRWGLPLGEAPVLLACHVQALEQS